MTQGGDEGKWWRWPTDFLRILARAAYGFPRAFLLCGWRILYGFLVDLGEEAYGLFTDFYRILGMRLPDCLRIFTGFGGGGLRIVYGFWPDVKEEAYGWFTDFYRIGGRRLTDCLRIFTGCRGRGLRIVHGFVPDLGEEACGLFIDLDRIWGFVRISAGQLTDSWGWKEFWSAQVKKIIHRKKMWKKAVLTSKHSVCYQSLSSAI